MNDLNVTTRFEHLSTMDILFNPAISERIKDIAVSMAKGQVTIPEHLRGNVGDCLAIVIQAVSWRLNPYVVAQKTHIIHGQLGYEAQLINAVTASLGILEGSFDYEYHGNWDKIAVAPKIMKSERGPYSIPGWKPEDEVGLKIVITGKLRKDRNPKSLALALSSVWPRNSGVWATDPQQQLSYLAVKKWVRRYAPEAILGIYTTDEVMEKEVTGEVVFETEKKSVQEIIERTEPSKKEKPKNEDSFVAPRMMQEQTDQKKPKTEQEVFHETHDKAEKKIKDEDEKDAWPKIGDDGRAYDSRGIPNIPEIHGKTCTSANVWRKKRGISPDMVEKMEAPYLQKKLEQEENPSHEEIPFAETEQQFVDHEKIDMPLFASAKKFKKDSGLKASESEPEMFSHRWFNSMINTAESRQDLTEIRDMLQENEIIDKLGASGIAIVEAKLSRRFGDFDSE